MGALAIPTIDSRRIKRANTRKATKAKTPLRSSANRTSRHPAAKAILPLENGDHLTRAEFERRYEQYPEIKKAELIEGVVYVASPVKVEKHGEPHAHINGWLMVYCAGTPSIRLADNSTYRLDNDNEPQPDVTVWIDQKHGGETAISDDDYLEGTPELVVEVAGSSATIDLRQKLRAYRRKGIQEYLVLLVYEQETRWFSLDDGEYISLTADEQGVIRSQVFPGLWLDTQRFWQKELAGLLATLQQGIATPEHATFVEQLAAKSS